MLSPFTSSFCISRVASAHAALIFIAALAEPGSCQSPLQNAEGKEGCCRQEGCGSPKGWDEFPCLTQNARWSSGQAKRSDKENGSVLHPEVKWCIRHGSAFALHSWEKRPGVIVEMEGKGVFAVEGCSVQHLHESETRTRS